MMDEKTTKAVIRFLEQTQQSRLKWGVSDPVNDLTQTGETVVRAIYISEKDGRLLRLYKFKVRSYTDEDEWHWEDGVALEVSDAEHRAWWRFPHSPVIWDLLEAVTFKSAGIDAFINKVVEEK